MRTRSIIAYVGCALSHLGCEDEPNTSTRTLPIQPDGSAPLDAGLLDGNSSVPEGLSCGGLVGLSTCDPVTAWPCDTRRENCVYSASRSAYRCEEIPNQLPLCSPCDEVNAFCGPGLLCNSYLGCERFCCTDSDCPVGRCIPNAYLDDDVALVGYCAEETRAVCTGDDAGATP